ncbi:MAG TPA: hypothetical protein VKE74_20010 [Gemmataceae bacterium]|nr:hypothetical protein [Gemmataceae bacterium]
MGLIEIGLAPGLVYTAVGLVVGFVFVTASVARIDPAARGTSVAFRLLILPGSAALWPVLVAKWARHQGESP